MIVCCVLWHMFSILLCAQILNELLSVLQFHCIAIKTNKLQYYPTRLTINAFSHSTERRGIRAIFRKYQKSKKGLSLIRKMQVLK